MPVAISPKQTMSLFEDKVAFGRYVSRNVSFDIVPQVYSSLNEIRYPCIVKLFTKGHRVANGAGVYFVHNITIFENIFQKVRLKLNFDPNNVLVQEAIVASNEYHYYFVAYQGKILAGLENQLCKTMNMASHIQSYTGNIENSTFIPCTSIPYWPAIDEFIKTISKQWKFNGMGCIDFKLNSTNYPKIFEINPRLCGTIARQKITMALQLNSWWNERKFSMQS